jgi:protein phosphatase
MKLFHFNHIGNRNTQEDDLFVDPNGKLFMVCDGVGGHDHGEKASALLIATLANCFADYNGNMSLATVNSIISTLHEDFKSQLNGNSKFDGMASTLVLLYLLKDKAIVSHIGDSRLYHIKDRHSWWVTKDHSMVMELKEAGIIETEKQMNEHPLRNRITNAVKISTVMEPLSPESTEINNITTGDLFFMCTDGVMESFTTSQELVDLLTQQPIENVWQRLEGKCKQYANDNFTAILIEL